MPYKNILHNRTLYTCHGIWYCDEDVKIQKHFWSQTSAWLSWVADCRWAWYSLVTSHQEQEAITADLSKVWDNQLLPVTSLRWHRDSRADLESEALFQSRCFCWPDCGINAWQSELILHWALRQKRWTRWGSRPGGFCPPNVGQSQTLKEAGKRLWRVCVLHGPGLAFILQLSDWIN